MTIHSAHLAAHATIALQELIILLHTSPTKNHRKTLRCGEKQIGTRTKIKETRMRGRVGRYTGTCRGWCCMYMHMYMYMYMLC